MSLASRVNEDVAVLIVGGGGAGLTASMLLAREGVEHLLVSALPTTSILPKAHVLNQRTMEILEDAGVAGAIAQRSTPAANMAATAFYAGLAGPTAEYGRRIARLEAWGAGGADESWSAASPWRQLNLPQIRLEPLMKAHAETLSPGRIRFGHELTALEQDGEGVTATVRDLGAGDEYIVHARYVIGADGGRTVPGLIGVELRGPGPRDRDRDDACRGRLLGARAGRRRSDPLAALSADRRHGRDGSDGTGALGAGVGGVGDPHQLPRR